MDKNLEQDNTDRYVEYINEHILGKIDYDKLENDYGTKEKAYTKAVLHALHKAAVTAYGTDYFDGFDKNEYVLLPGIIRSRVFNHICLALLEIDLESSGEHCDTTFLSRYGLLRQFDENRPPKAAKIISDLYSNYEYAYTIGIETDHHVDFDRLHPDIIEILNTFENYEFTPIEQQDKAGNVNDTEGVER